MTAIERGCHARGTTVYELSKVTPKDLSQVFPVQGIDHLSESVVACVLGAADGKELVLQGLALRGVVLFRIRIVIESRQGLLNGGHGRREGLCALSRLCGEDGLVSVLIGHPAPLEVIFEVLKLCQDSI